MTRGSSRAAAWGWAFPALLLLAPRASAHPGAEDHRHEPGSAAAREHDDERAAPTPSQIAKRIERVKKTQAERTAHRAARREEERRALRALVQRRLAGRPITAALSAELGLHARRLARLRRIRFVAAERGDYPSVRRADKALALEKGRHERWWREQAPAATAVPSETAAP